VNRDFSIEPNLCLVAFEGHFEITVYARYEHEKFLKDSLTDDDDDDDDPMVPSFNKSQ
jgi:hypothetical protein